MLGLVGHDGDLVGVVEGFEGEAPLCFDFVAYFGGVGVVVGVDGLLGFEVVFEGGFCFVVVREVECLVDVVDGVDGVFHEVFVFDFDEVLGGD